MFCYVIQVILLNLYKEVNYKIYAGLAGGFGGAYYQYTTNNHPSLEDAEAEAYKEACDIFESQMGYGIESQEDLQNEAVEALAREDYESEEDYLNAVSEYAQGLEDDLRETWIEYYVEEDEDDEEDDYEEDGFWDNSDEF